jgi:hypothetical protein
MMGGGMGGRGMMGGMMGGGFRSVPPTDLPAATLKPNQTRHLPTRLVALGAPDPERSAAGPAKGEKLKIGEVSQVTVNPRVQKALKRLAADKAPTGVSQLVMWRVASNLDWETIEQLAKKGATAHELSLAKDFVAKLDMLPEGDSGTLLCEIRGADAALAADLSQKIDGQLMLGLPVKTSVPAQPAAPSVACKVEVTGTAEKPEAQVHVAASDGAVTRWVPCGQFTIPIERKDGKVAADKFADALADGLLSRLVRAQLSKGPMVKGKQMYKIKIDNASPLLLNGLAIKGTLDTPNDKLKLLAGDIISIAPLKSWTAPASGDTVEELGLKKGIRVVAADLSGL